MSDRQAVFIINNIRIIRVVLTIAAILPVLILSSKAATPIDTVSDGAKTLATMDSNQLLAAVAICAIAGFCWTQWALSRSLASIDKRIAVMAESLHALVPPMSIDGKRHK